MNRHRWMFEIREDDLQLAASDGFRDVIGIKTSQAAPPDRGREGRSNGVHDKPRIEMYDARDP